MKANNLLSAQSKAAARRGAVLTGLTLLTALAAALVLAGCASTGNIKPHAASLNADAVGLNTGAAAPVVAADWWQGFGDAALNQLIDKALADSPSLKLAQSRIEQAQAAAEGVGAAERPQLNAELDANRQHFSKTGIYPPPLGGATLNIGTLQANGSWELDFFGRNRSALDAAVGAQRAAEADAQAARVLLAANVTHGYFQLARLVEQRDVAQRSLGQREEILALVRERVQAGLDTSVELRQSEGSLPETRQQLEALDEQIALARHALAALTVQPPQALDGLTPHLQPVQAVPLPAAVPADLLGRRADIAAARWRVEAANKGVASARASFYPNINLVAFAGFNSIGFGNLLKSDSKQYGFGPAFSLPIFDGGRLRANLHGKSAELDAAVESYNSSLIDAVRDVADQIASLQSIDRQQTEQAAAQTSAESAYDLALQRYKAGLGTYLTVLTAEGNVLAQRRQATDLKARQLDTQVALIRSLGGGYAAGADMQTAQASN
ncbi:MAG TPA: efflux transporter outer membrane subunit [Methylibium sp.]